MKFKRLLATTMAGILTLTGALAFTPISEYVAHAEETMYTKFVTEHIFETYGSSSAIFLT